MHINWDNFKTYNQDARGVHYKFEDLCRRLFINENLSGNKHVKYLHASPNNYGLETEPIFDETRQMWIGFQAKFFEGNVDYNQIMHSAKKIVEYYTGKAGKVNLVFLFCNKAITTTPTTKRMKDIINLLKQNNIELQLITDTAILDLVVNKYPYLGLYYFGNHTINLDWFVTNAGHMYDNLGERYNREFNVETECMNELSLFIHDQRAADYLNAKKASLLKYIDEFNYRQGNKRAYLEALREATTVLPNVDVESLYDALNWENTVKQRVQGYIDKLREENDSLKRQLEEVQQISYKKDLSEDERKIADKKENRIRQRIDDLISLIDLPEVVAIDKSEQSLLCKPEFLLKSD